MAKNPVPAQPAPAVEFVKFAETAQLLNIGTTRLAEIERTDPTFPAAVWLGERAKRYVRAEVLAWALAKRRNAPATPPAAPASALRPPSGFAAARAGMRAVS